MRSGLWRGVTLAIALAAGGPASAQFHVIPKYAPTIDYRTGQPMMAPPVPYGEYAKDYVGCVTGLPGSCLGKLCGLCRGLGCGLCHNRGWGDACGTCGGSGHGCGHCKGSGLGHGHGGGLFHRGGGACGDPACGGHGHGGGLLGHGRGGKHLGHHGGVVPSAQSIAASPQGPIVAPSTQCGGCGGKGCGLCGGKGWLGHHGAGGLCGDPGCGLFGKRHHGGRACGDPGCGTCGQGGHGLCKNCGGKGCGLCAGLLGGVHSAVANVLHIGGVRYFVGAGGPVPITPGYVNYVVPVRSPRDFFAFPPFVDIDP